ncbi:unnamed protein product [Rotaria sp. Silwood2]|nr:unnamed protein product [Rotaria sp. Silwood2]CAF4791899.1 unnamed protein product [Rotaria sp. Silwood2]
MSPTLSTVIGGSYGSGTNEFAYPSGIFVDESASKAIYVADTWNHRIQKWMPGATSGKTVAGQTGISGARLNQLAVPATLIVDINENMLIVDAGNNRIMLWTIGSSHGTQIAGTSTHGVLPNQLFSPAAISVDSMENLYVADFNNNRIQKFSVSCPTTTTRTTTQSATFTSKD